LKQFWIFGRTAGAATMHVGSLKLTVILCGDMNLKLLWVY